MKFCKFNKSARINLDESLFETAYNAQEVYTDDESKLMAKVDLGLIKKSELTPEQRRMYARKKLGLDRKIIDIDPKADWSPELRKEYAMRELGMKKDEEEIDEAIISRRRSRRKSDDRTRD